jgi:hypothetical protein
MTTALKEEDGVALVTAILASAVVLILSASAVSLAIHNTDSSGYDRRRLEAVDAAEAGIDYYYSLLGTTSLKNLSTVALPSGSGYTMDSSDPTHPCKLHGTTSTSPASSFTVTPEFYLTPTSTTPYSCLSTQITSLGTAYDGIYVKLTAVGQPVNLSSPLRTVESRARLSATGKSSVFPSGAVIGQTVTLSANVQIDSRSGTNDANVYADGNYTMNAGVLNVKGSIYAQGTVSIGGGSVSQVTGDLWAKKHVDVTGALIGGSVISSIGGTALLPTTTNTSCPGASPPSGAICLSGNTSVSGGAKAGGEIGIKSPAVVNGTKSPTTYGIGDPPTAPGLASGQTYPTYDVSNTAQLNTDFPGITNVSGCSAAQSAVDSWVDSGSTTAKYIRLTGCSTGFTFDRSSYALRGNLGIITDGPLTLGTPVRLSSYDSTPHTVYFFTGATQLNDPSATPCSGGNFQALSGSAINFPLKALIFTPKACQALLNSNGFDVTGQIFSGTVLFKSNTNLHYSPITLGSDAVNGSAGSLVDIVYKREVTSLPGA